jgi:hypothetical protein
LSLYLKLSDMEHEPQALRFGITTRINQACSDLPSDNYNELAYKHQSDIEPFLNSYLSDIDESPDKLSHRKSGTGSRFTTQNRGHTHHRSSRSEDLGGFNTYYRPPPLTEIPPGLYIPSFTEVKASIKRRNKREGGYFCPQCKAPLISGNCERGTP